MITTQETCIQIENGIEIHGLITFRSDADINVEIVSPYKGITAGLHIPYFSRPYHSFLTEYGDRTAENLLKYLYELGKYMEDNQKFIRLQFAFHFRDGDYNDREVQDRFFGSTFPFIVPIDTRSEVMEVIRNAKS